MESIEMFEIFKALFAGNEPDKVKELVETLMNALMVAEREKHNGAKVYEHRIKQRTAAKNQCYQDLSE